VGKGGGREREGRQYNGRTRTRGKSFELKLRVKGEPLAVRVREETMKRNCLDSILNKGLKEGTTGS
jgi:hypothetical protein